MADESPPPVEDETLQPPSTSTITTTTTATATATATATSLFPVSKQTPSIPLQVSNSTTSTWLCNTSFTTDLSTINPVASSLHDHYTEPEDDEQNPEQLQQQQQPRYELVNDSSPSDQDLDRKKEKRKRRKRKHSDYDEYGPSSRKQNIQSWANSSTTSSGNKEYYFDSRGDLDNLAFGSLYRSNF